MLGRKSHFVQYLKQATYFVPILGNTNKLNVDVTSKTHSTRLKYRILAYLPDLEAVQKGREIILLNREDIDSVGCKMVEETYDDEGKHLAFNGKHLMIHLMENI